MTRSDVLSRPLTTTGVAGLSVSQSIYHDAASIYRASVSIERAATGRQLEVHFEVNQTHETTATTICPCACVPKDQGGHQAWRIWGEGEGEQGL